MSIAYHLATIRPRDQKHTALVCFGVCVQGGGREQGRGSEQGRVGGLPSSVGSSNEEEEEKEEEMSLCGMWRFFGEGRLPLGTGLGRR